MSHVPPWRMWTYDTVTDEFVGACGHRYPNTPEGIVSLREHDCPDQRDHEEESGDSTLDELRELTGEEG